MIMNKILRFSLIALLAMVWGQMQAVETKVYSYVPQKNASNTAYASIYDVTYEGKQWSVPGNQYETGGLRIGGKSITSENRTITGKSAFEEEITKIVINHGGINNLNFVVNKITVTSATDADFTQNTRVCDYIPAEEDFVTINKEGVINFTDGVKFAANSYYKIDFNVTNPKSSNYYIKIKSIDFYADINEADMVKEPVLSLAEGIYYTEQTVTMTQPEEKDIYYTTDGSDPKSSTTAQKYSGGVLLTETTTLKAAAKDGEKWSTIVTHIITIAKEYASFKELQEAVTSTAQPAIINFKNAIITAVKGSNAYVVDEDGYGALIYENNNGFEVGDKISGKAQGSFVLYTGKTEITGVVSTSEGITITKGNTVPVTVTTIDALTKKEQSSVVTLNGLTLDASSTDTKVILTDGTNQIQAYNSFMTLPTFEAGKTYNVTGVVVWYNNTLEIAPRTESDVVDTSVGISNITTDTLNENAPIYNLAGQRVSKDAKGILIQNGKKFVNK